MNSISYSQLRRTIAAGGELQTRSKAHEAEMVLTIAEEAALEEWCPVMYRCGSPVRLDIFRRMAVAILGGRERRNIEAHQIFLSELWSLNCGASVRVWVQREISDVSRIGIKDFSPGSRTQTSIQPALDNDCAMNNSETIT